MLISRTWNSKYEEGHIVRYINDCLPLYFGQPCEITKVDYNFSTNRPWFYYNIEFASGCKIEHVDEFDLQPANESLAALFKSMKRLLHENRQSYDNFKKMCLKLRPTSGSTDTKK